MNISIAVVKFAERVKTDRKMASDFSSKMGKRQMVLVNDTIT